MTRSLEGKVFYEDRNNGVYALVAEEVFNSRVRFDKIRQVLSAHPPVNDGRQFDVALLSAIPLPRRPIFTFVSSQTRSDESPWFTGNEAMLDNLREHILDEGGRIEQSSVWVPFSNGAEMGYHGLDAQCAELWYVTTDEQFFQAFGITLEDLKKR